MRNLIIPMAGNSSRFPNMRPKWMLTHPMTGRFMAIEAILGLNLEFFDHIYFVCLKEHEEKYQFHNGFAHELEALNLLEKSHIIFLDKQTKSQSETVCELIHKSNIDGFIFIKDSDGYYECEITEPINQVAYFDLNDMENINAKTKSYLQFDINHIITNIVEKKVISSTFSVGGYGFESAVEFCEIYKKLSDIDGECYVSHIIFEMILSGSLFSGLPTTDFKDWGTLDAWNAYKKQYKCLFVDIDGTLVTNSSTLFPPYVGEGIAIQENIDYLNELYSSGKVKIILTTSRPEEYKETTLNEMKEKGISYDQLIMGLPHAQRVVINDFARSNPYPSAKAINIPRNANNLREFFE